MGSRGPSFLTRRTADKVMDQETCDCVCGEDGTEWSKAMASRKRRRRGRGQGTVTLHYNTFLRLLSGF